MIVRNHQARICINRILDFLTRNQSLRIIAAACMFTAVYGAGIVMHAEEAATAATPSPAAAPSDTDKPQRAKSHIVQTSTGELTITFSSCRENDKQHVSCQFKDADGTQHWVYLPGVTLPPSK